MNGAARNVHTQVFVWTGSHHSGCTLKRGTGESSGNPILALGRTFRLSFKDLYHSVFPPRVMAQYLQLLENTLLAVFSVTAS